MIYTALLLSLFMAETSNALKLHSPVHITRPLDDVHVNCEQDIALICNNINIDNLIPDTMNDNSQKYLYPEEKDDETLLPRRQLTETGSDGPISRSISIKIGLRVTPKGSKGLEDQHAKDNRRFLNYGPDQDTCLWNAFDTKQVSSPCAASLTRINEITDYPTMKYSNESEYIKRTSISISFPLVTLVFLVLGCVLFRELCSEEDDENDSDNEADSDYHVLDEKKMIAHIAVPLEVI